VVNGREFRASIGGQDWRVGWYPPPDPPPGTPHGAEAVCVAGGRIVLVSRDGQLWGLPAGRPEGDEDWADTLSRGVCVRGPQEGLALVRSHWRAEVRVQRWQPRFEMTHRRLVPADEALRSLTIPEGLRSLYRRMFAEAAISAVGP
jgi:hypothetical protein